MGCNLVLKAKNGENSKLFKSILKESPDTRSAIELYYYTKTDEFKKQFGTEEKNPSKFDDNGEPLYTKFSSTQYSGTEDFLNAELDADVKVYTTLVDAVPRMTKEIEKQLGGLKRRKQNETTKSLIKNLETIKDELTKDDVTVSIPKFFRAAEAHLEGVKRRIDKLKADPVKNIKQIAHMYKVSEGYSMVSEINTQLLSDENTREILNMADTDFSGSNIGNSLTAIRSSYLSAAKKALAEEFHKRNPQIDKRTIEKALDEAPRDIRMDEMWLEYMGDSQDKVIGMVAAMVAEMHTTVRDKVIELSRDTDEKVRALREEFSTDEAMYGPMMYEDNGSFFIYDIHSKEAKHVNGINKLTSNQKDFLVHFTNNYKQMQNIIPKYEQMEGRIPTVLKGLIEEMQGQSWKERAKGFVDIAKNSVKVSNLDMHHGNSVDSNGNPIRSVPTFYTQAYNSLDYKTIYDKAMKEMEDSETLGVAEMEKIAKARAEKEARSITSSRVSKDLGNSLIAFGSMAYNFGVKNEMIHYFEAAENIVGSEERQYGTGVSHSGDKTFKSGIGTNADRSLKQFIDMQVYGVKDKKLKNVGGYDTSKIYRKLGSMNSFIQLTGNVKAVLATLGMGKIANWIEGLAGEHFNSEDLLKSKKWLTKHLPGFLGDIGKTVPTGMLNLMDEHYNILQSFNRDQKSGERTKIVKLMKSDSLYFMNNGSEFAVQMTTATAMMQAIEVFDKDGKSKGNLLENHKVEKGVLKIPDVYIKNNKGKLEKFDKGSQQRLRNKMSAHMRKMYGNYSAETAQLAKQDARAALLLQFRGFAYEGVVRRFGAKNYNVMMDQDTEGYYASTYNFLKKVNKDLTSLNTQAITEKWGELSAHEKANIVRTALEAGTILALYSATYLLSAIDSSFEEEGYEDSFTGRLKSGAMAMMVYETNRLYTEMSAFSNPSESLVLLSSPLAVTSMIVSMKKVGQNLMSPFEEYESGWRSGENKLVHSLGKIAPIYKQIQTLNGDAIREQAKFYNR